MESRREPSESCLDQQGMKSIKLEWVYFVHASYFRFPLSLWLDCSGEQRDDCGEESGRQCDSFLSRHFSFPPCQYRSNNGPFSFTHLPLTGSSRFVLLGTIMVIEWDGRNM